MLTDVGGLGLALFAIWMTERPATPLRTYGYYRVEILAALANAVVLLLVSGVVLLEAYERFHQPPTVASLPMLAVAMVGVLVNAGSNMLRRSGSSERLNLKGPTSRCCRTPSRQWASSSPPASCGGPAGTTPTPLCPLASLCSSCLGRGA